MTLHDTRKCVHLLACQVFALNRRRFVYYFIFYIKVHFIEYYIHVRIYLYTSNLLYALFFYYSEAEGRKREGKRVRERELIVLQDCCCFGRQHPFQLFSLGVIFIFIHFARVAFELKNSVPWLVCLCAIFIINRIMYVCLYCDFFLQKIFNILFTDEWLGFAGILFLTSKLIIIEHHIHAKQIAILNRLCL